VELLEEEEADAGSSVSLLGAVLPRAGLCFDHSDGVIDGCWFHTANLWHVNCSPYEGYGNEEVSDQPPGVV
jgi:hypothetical protein